MRDRPTFELGGLLSGVLLAIVLAVAMPAIQVMAQTKDEAAKARLRQIQPTLQEGATAADIIAAPGEISFDDVLASPDDAGLNFRYAQEMIQEGRLDVAATALERILILNPDLDRVRLLYAVVLFRLDSVDEAEVEFRLLQKRKLGRREAREVERYVALIEKRQQRVKGSATFSAGLHYDSNRTAFPENGVLQILGVPVAGLGREEDDWGQILVATVDFRAETDLQRAREVFLTFSSLLDNQHDIDRLDTFALLIDTGIVYEAPFATITPKLHLDTIYLGMTEYTEDIAGSIRLSRRLFSPNFVAYLEGEIGHESFDNSADLPFASEQSGLYYGFTAGGGYAITRSLKLDAFYRYKNKEANTDYEAYDSHLISGRLTWVMPRQMFVMLDGSVEWQKYDGPDPFISAETREDTDYGLSLTYGMPMSALALFRLDQDPMPQAVRDIVLSLSGGYFKSDSNVPNFDYENWRAQMLLTKRFDF